jgi:glycosyltransferase involved in cell wall biosynthesis
MPLAGTMSNWVIVASGLQGLGGHNFTYTEIVRDSFRERGVEPLVLVNKAVSAEFASTFRLRPAFLRGAYDFPRPGTWSTFIAWRTWALEFANELAGALPSGGANIFSHTISEFELQAWARLAPRLPKDASLTLLFRGTPGYRQMPWWKRTLHPYFGHRPACLRSLRAALGTRFRAVTDSEELSADLRVVYRGRVETFPIPIDPMVLARNQQRNTAWASSDLTLGYLGDGRPAKGFDLLPLVAKATANTPGVRLLLQCFPPGGRSGASPSFDRAREALEQARASGQSIKLVEDRLSREDYASLVAAMDVVIIPYTSHEYRESTSGIFAEAVATGKPVVVPAETWMAAELERGFGAGVIYAPGGRESLANACLEAIRRQHELSSRAARVADPYAKRNSPGALVDQLLTGASRGGSVHPSV